jgi:hypothetical protein
MTKRAIDLAPDEQPGAPRKERPREITAAPTVGGVFDEDGTCLQPGGLPEPDAHRLKKPER